MEEVTTYTEGDTSAPPDLRFIHFNDGQSKPRPCILLAFACIDRI